MKKFINTLFVLIIISTPQLLFGQVEDVVEDRCNRQKIKCLKICAEDDYGPAREACYRVCETMCNTPNSAAHVDPKQHADNPSQIENDAVEPNEKVIELISIHRPQLFPNPVDNLFSVSFISEMEGKINIYGKDAILLKSTKLAPSISEQTHQFDVSNFEPGPYYVEIITEDDRKVIQFIKE